MSAGALRGLVVLVAVAALGFAAPAHAAISVLDNGTIRVAVDLDHGGKMTWLSRSQGDHADNLLFESEQSYYGADGWHAYQDPATVVDNTNDGRTLYVRSFDAACECTMDTWITLHGSAAVVRNRLTSFRSDAKVDPTGNAELPALYTSGSLYRTVTYDGATPFRHGPVDDLTQSALGTFFEPDALNVRAPEHWVALLGDDAFGVGLVEPSVSDFVLLSNGFGAPDGNLGGYAAGTRSEVWDSNVVYDYTYTLVVGTLSQIRAYAYKHRPDPRPSYLFAHDRQHFIEQNATDAGFPIAGALRVQLDQDDPQLIGPDQQWPAKRVPQLYVRGAWHASQSLAELFWGHAGESFSSARMRPFRVIPDGEFHTYRLELFRSPTYTGTIDGVRLDPIAIGEPGSWVDVTCISWRPCPIDRAAERRLSLDDGRIPFLDVFDALDTSFWSVTGNSAGATASVTGGELAIDVAPTAQPLTGQDYVSAGLYSKCTLTGNFDAQVDYRLKGWPDNNGVNVNFSVGNGTVFLHSLDDQHEWVSSYFPPFPVASAVATGQLGALRLVRSGGSLVGYYRGPYGGWIRLDSESMTREPVNVSLSIYTTRSATGAQEVDVAFDNFRVTRGGIQCQ
jgi:hypothetical protein